MSDIGSLSIGGPAYIAMKSRADGWLEANQGIGNDLLPTDDEDERVGPPELKHYGATRAISLAVARDYGGIGSSGGPLVSGRSDHGEFEVEQSTNSTSSTIFQHCCAGTQFELVHMVLVGESLDLDVSTRVDDPTRKLHIRLTDAYIGKFQFTGGRYFGDQYSSFTGEKLLDSKSVIRGGKMLGVSHVVKYTFVYTAVSFELGGVERGWHTGEDVAWP